MYDLERCSPSPGASRTLRRAAVLAGGILGLIATIAAGSTVSAHSGVQSYVYLSLFDDRLDGRVEYPIDDLGPALEIDFPAEADDRLELAADRIDDIIAYTDTHLDLGGVGGDTWQLRFDREPTMLETAAGDYLQVWFEVDEQFDDAPRTFIATYDGIIESNPERDALLLIENDWGSATFGNEGEHLLGFSVGAETQTVEIDEVSSIESVYEVGTRASIAIDRSLVVLVAIVGILGGALLADRRADSSVAIAAGLRRLGERLPLFTLAMLVTTGVLGLASIDLGERTSFGIAAVGVLLAAASMRVPAGAVRPVVFASGATVGCVLAYQFLVQHLDRSRPLLAFLGFTIGAIVTVAVITAMLLPLGLLLRAWTRAPIAATVLGAAVALAGVVWLAERIVGVKFPLREAELDVADLLTSPIVVALVTVVAGALTLRSATPTESPAESADVGELESERIEA